MVYLFKLSIGQSVEIPLADLVSMFIEKKSATCSWIACTQNNNFK